MSISLTIIPAVLLVNAILTKYDKDEINLSETKDSIELNTSFKDEGLLIKTLEDYGAQYNRESDGSIRAYLPEIEFTLRLKDDSSYKLEVSGSEEQIGELYRNLVILDEVYKQNVQNYTYEQIKSKLAGSDMSLEREEVLEDNSIVLTLSV